MSKYTNMGLRLTQYNAVIRDQKNHLLETLSWKEDDAKITIYEKIAVSIDDARMSLYFAGSGFLESAKENEEIRSMIFDTANLHIDYLSYITRNYEASISRSLILTLHQSLESSIRLLEGNDTGGLTRVYKDFLNRTSISKKDEYHNLLEIIRTWRNSVHANGIYNDARFANFNKNYNGLSVNLTKGDKVVIDWPDIETVIEGIMYLMKDLASDSYFTTSLGYIQDPAY